MTRAVIAFNDDTDLKPHLNEVERLGEIEVAATAQEIAALTGWRLLPVRDVRKALDELRADPPEMVFNLCEGVAGRPEWEMHFALALEMLGIPFTGADPTAAGICHDKALTRKLLKTAGIPLPAEYGNGRSISGRWIVKPVHEDAGIGIDASSVCSSHDEVTSRVEHVTSTYRQPALVEEFIDGRELSQALYFGKGGPVVLPPGEIVFSSDLPRESRVVGWKAKWAEGSAEDRSTVNQTPAVIEDTLRGDVSDVSLQAASVLSVRGYCRFDIRQRPTGELCIIDVNPNPDIGRGSGFRKALEAAGIAFEEFLRELMMAALSRHRP